jgi:hypothetical protein
MSRYLTKDQAAPFIKPFDESDENDVRADKYRQLLVNRAARAVRDGGNDEYMSFIGGSFVGLAQVLMARGMTPDETWKALTAMIAFGIAQATNGEYVPAELVNEVAEPRGRA